MTCAGFATWIWGSLVLLGAAAPVEQSGQPEFGRAEIRLGEQPAPPASAAVCGLVLVAHDTGPQVLVTQHPPTYTAGLRGGEEVTLAVPVRGVTGPCVVTAEATLRDPADAEATLWLDEARPCRKTLRQGTVQLEAPGEATAQGIVVRMKSVATPGEAAVAWRNIRLRAGDRWFDVPLSVESPPLGNGPPRVLPELRRPLEDVLIEWDWRMQDGIDTLREPSTYAAAIEQTLRRGDELLADLQVAGVAVASEAAQWAQLQAQWKELSTAAATAEPSQWEALWRQVHTLRRRIALSNPLAQVGPLALVKHVPAMFSHQLTQYEGKCARPGGGVFVLESPGQSMQCRQLAAGSLPLGNYEHLDVSWDGQRILFAYCHAETTPRDREEHLERHYHLYEVQADGSGLRQLTDGPYDDFSPRYLPDGKILFLSTRRGGFHRCGRGPCNVFTMALCKADGSESAPDLVPRDARVGPGRAERRARDLHALGLRRPPRRPLPAALVGAARRQRRADLLRQQHTQPGRRVGGPADARLAAGDGHGGGPSCDDGRLDHPAGHHARDRRPGADHASDARRAVPRKRGPGPEELARAGGRHEEARHARGTAPLAGPLLQAPYPLSEKYFLVSYSFDALIGEPSPNPANMFGLYLVDAFGNKELLYRDLNFCSLWPMPVRPRPLPDAVPSLVEPSDKPEGTFLLQDVHQGWPALPPGAIKRLRVVQVLPKSTPHANTPTVGLPNASPGRQVLGTVPVEPDGSAYFRAPVRHPLGVPGPGRTRAGRADHAEPDVPAAGRDLRPASAATSRATRQRRPAACALALSRPPSAIQPGPDGSKPFSYPILVQPVLDKKCVSCHNAQKPEGKVILTGEPQGQYTASYNALGPRVPTRPGAASRATASRPAMPDRFGARGSKLMKLLLAGHEDVVLTPEEIERLVTWMDTNVLFYGTFDPADQARQQRGERIAGPGLQ